jgi:putative transposase
MMYPLVTDLAADGIAVAVTCRVLSLCKQAYYRWVGNPVTDRDWDDAHLINAARMFHADDPTFGYRFIKDQLETVGIIASENRVNRLCAQQRLWSLHARKRGLSRRAGPPVHDDLVGKNFTATGPDEKWLTDITEHQTREGKLYVCAVKDVWSNRIVGYSAGDRMTADLAVTALRNAIIDRRPVNTVVHSDRGSQFRSSVYVSILKHNQLRGSMGRVGACGDNAAMESFFALIQKNVLDTRRWDNRDQLRQAITEWIETKYHRRRRQRRLGRHTPITFEKLHWPLKQAA